jgi:hypothetical protein
VPGVGRLYRNARRDGTPRADLTEAANGVLVALERQAKRFEALLVGDFRY